MFDYKIPNMGIDCGAHNLVLHQNGYLKAEHEYVYGTYMVNYIPATLSHFMAMTQA